MQGRYPGTENECSVSGGVMATQGALYAGIGAAFAAGDCAAETFRGKFLSQNANERSWQCQLSVQILLAKQYNNLGVRR